MLFFVCLRYLYRTRLQTQTHTKGYLRQLPGWLLSWRQILQVHAVSDDLLTLMSWMRRTEFLVLNYELFFIHQPTFWVANGIYRAASSTPASTEPAKGMVFPPVKLIGFTMTVVYIQRIQHDSTDLKHLRLSFALCHCFSVGLCSQLTECFKSVWLKVFVQYQAQFWAHSPICNRMLNGGKWPQKLLCIIWQWGNDSIIFFSEEGWHRAKRPEALGKGRGYLFDLYTGCPF